MNKIKQNRRTYDANYYQRNREERLKQVAAWKLANPEKVKQYREKSRLKNLPTAIFFQMIAAAADLRQAFSRMAHPGDTPKA